MLLHPDQFQLFKEHKPLEFLCIKVPCFISFRKLRRFLSGRRRQNFCFFVGVVIVGISSSRSIDVSLLSSSGNPIAAAAAAAAGCLGGIPTLIPPVNVKLGEM
jgi:hypothetical protein